MFHAKALICKELWTLRTEKSSLYFVKTEIVEPKYGSFLARMMQLRQKADYNCAYDITQMDLDEYITLSKDFVRKMDELV